MSQNPDGFAYYNFYTFDFGEHYPNLRTWLNPESSENMSRHYFNGRKLLYHANEKDTFDNGIAFDRTELIPGQPGEFPFRFATPFKNQLPILRMVFKNMNKTDVLNVSLNGGELKAGKMEEKQVEWKNKQQINALFWSCELTASQLKLGENTLTVELVGKSDPTRIIEAGEFEIVMAPRN